MAVWRIRYLYQKHFIRNYSNVGILTNQQLHFHMERYKNRHNQGELGDCTASAAALLCDIS